MTISKHCYIILVLFLPFITYNNQSCDTVKVAQPLINETFIDEVIHELNSSSCKGDQSLHYLEKIIEFCAVHKKEYGSLKSILKLFSNRFKGIEYVNSSRLSSFLDKLHVCVPKCTGAPRTTTILNDPASFDRFSSSIKTQLITNFSTRFDDFKANPEIFIANLAQTITHQAEQEMDLAQMQNTIVRLLEITVSKTIWSPYDQEKTWENVKLLSKQFVLLLEENIIGDVDELDDLLWSLIHRYCYFFELTGSLLTPEFYKTVLNDLENGKLLFSLVEEQDELLKPKTVFLKEKILTAQAKALSTIDKKTL